MTPTLFNVFYWNQRTRKVEQRGVYRLGSFKRDYGTPSEKKIFQEAISSGKIYVTQVQSMFPLEKPWLLYHRTLEELEAEYDEIKSQINDGAISIL